MTLAGKPPQETNTSSEQPASFLSAKYLRGTTRVAFVWSILLGSWEVGWGGGRTAVLGFCGFVFLLGMGLRSLAAEVFRR